MFDRSMQSSEKNRTHPYRRKHDNSFRRRENPTEFHRFAVDRWNCSSPDQRPIRSLILLDKNVWLFSKDREREMDRRRFLSLRTNRSLPNQPEFAKMLDEIFFCRAESFRRIILKFATDWNSLASKFFVSTLPKVAKLSWNKKIKCSLISSPRC